MEVKHFYDIGKNQHEFKAVMNYDDFTGMTEKALVAQVETLITRIVNKLVEHFLDAHRDEIMKHVSVLDIVKQVNEKAGDKLILELLQQMRIKV